MLGQTTDPWRLAKDRFDHLMISYGSEQSFANVIYESIKAKLPIDIEVTVLFEQICPGLLPTDWRQEYLSYNSSIPFLPAEWIVAMTATESKVHTSGISTDGFPIWSIILLVGAALFMFFGKRK